MQVQEIIRAAVYARISETDDRYDKVSAQVKACRDLAKREGYTVVEVFKDDGIGAFKDTNRPGFLGLLEAVERRQFDVLLAVAEDRFARQPRVSIQLGEVCADAGTTWHTVRDGKLDPGSQEGELLSFFRGYHGRQEQRNKVEAIKRRFEKQRAEGLPLWGVRPFAFQINRIDHHPAEAVELRWAYETIIANGGKVYPIMQAWRQRGVRTTRGNDFSYATVRQLLLRPRNAGLMERDGQVIEDVPAQWEPIVSREVWDQARALLSDPGRSTTTSREPRWLCAGLVHCWCGSRMRSGSGSDRKGRFSIYRCSSTNRQPGSRHASIKCDDLDPLVRAAVVSAFMHAPPAALPTTIAEVADVQRLGARLREVRQGIADLLAMVGTPGVNSASITKRTAELGREAEEIERELDQHRQQSAHAAMLLDAQAALWTGKAPARRSKDRSRRVSIEDAADVKAQLEERFDSLPLEQRRTLVRSLLTVTVRSWKRGASADRVEIKHRTLSDLDTTASEA
jgi:site-specific DNA recombinase